MSFAVIVIQNSISASTVFRCCCCWHFSLTFGNIPNCNSAPKSVREILQYDTIIFCLGLYGPKISCRCTSLFRGVLLACDPIDKMNLYGNLQTLHSSSLPRTETRHTFSYMYTTYTERMHTNMSNVLSQLKWATYICIEISRYCINWYMPEFLMQSAVLENWNHSKS